jgi:hypothetical protein
MSILFSEWNKELKKKHPSFVLALFKAFVIEFVPLVLVYLFQVTLLALKA